MDRLNPRRRMLFALVAALATAHAVAADGGRTALKPARPMAAVFSGMPDVAGALASGKSIPTTGTAIDIDEDGRTDLVAAYALPDGGGALAVFRGAESLGLRPQAEAIRLAEPPEFLVAADVDADGRVDLVAGRRGASRLTQISLGGTVGARTREVALPGRLTALASGEFDRADGIADVVAAVETPTGPQLLVFEHYRGAFHQAPEVVALPAPATALAFGAFDAAWPLDLAVIAGSDLLVLSGRERILAGEPAAAAAIRTVPTGVPAIGLTAVRATLPLGALQDLAVLGADGMLRVFAPGSTTQRAVVAASGATAVVAAKVASFAGEDLLLLGSEPRVVSFDGAAPVVTRVEGPSHPAAVVPMRLDGDALTDLAILGGGSAPATSLTGNDAPFVVNVSTDGADAAPGDGVCEVTPATGDCSLRAAIQEANALAGADAITFSGVTSISPTSALPAITESVTIDGGAGRVELVGTGAGTGSNGFLVSGTGSAVTIRSMVVNQFNGAGIRLETANNVVENCYVGLNASGVAPTTRNGGGGILITSAAATGNRIGGSTTAERNFISFNASNGVTLAAGASGNTVAGNVIGRTVADAGSGNSNDGVQITGASTNNTIGGTPIAPGTPPGNQISSNSGDGVDITGSGTNGNVVSGNLIGTNLAGTSGAGNSQNTVFIQSGAQSNTVGGTTNAHRNILSGGIFSSSDGVEINGTGTNTNAVLGNYIGLDLNGVNQIGNAAEGVLVQGGAQNNAIGAPTPDPGRTGGNVISGNSLDGIRINSSTTTGTTIRGNIIGLQASGTAAQRNLNHGIFLSAAASTTIGGATSDSRNIIAGHTGSFYGITIQSTGASSNTIAGNYIGTDITGSVAIANGLGGVQINVTSGSASGNTIGGLTATPGTAPGNVISGNTGDGIVISGTAVSGTTVQGNIVGLNAAGSAALRNTGNGIQVTSSSKNNTIGGTTSTARNLVSGNDNLFSSDGIDVNGSGVTGNVVQGNWVGLDVTGTVAIPNGGAGIRIGGGAQSNTIGGTAPAPGQAPGNVVSGNGNKVTTQVSGGILLESSNTSSNAVRGNIVGATPDGLSPLSNRTNGIAISASASTNTIGGDAAGDRNLISGNSFGTGVDGIEINQASTNTVKGNWIGVDLNGTAALANGGSGVLVTDGGGLTSTSSNVIGGSANFARNVISGNTGNGVTFQGGFATGNSLQGNFIGTRPDGVTALANGGHGVRAFNGGSNNTVGGTTGVTAAACTGVCNVIAFNTAAGVAVEAASSNTDRIAIRGNSIHSNGGLGIDLAANGVTPNDALDADPGPNTLQNFPVITSVSQAGGNTTIQGTLSSTAGATFTIEAFANASPDPSGNGEGQTFLGSTPCTTDGGGNCSWTIVATGLFDRIAATAIGSTGNTSEFSVTVNAPPPDSDGDGVPDAADCAPLDAGSFAIPGEAANLVFSDKDNFAWDSLAPTSGPATAYDAMRGDLGAFPVASGNPDQTCVAPSTGTTGATDASVPAEGAGFYYLVRGRNVCGIGTWGAASDAIARTSTACP